MLSLAKRRELSNSFSPMAMPCCTSNMANLNLKGTQKQTKTVLVIEGLSFAMRSTAQLIRDHPFISPYRSVAQGKDEKFLSIDPIEGNVRNEQPLDREYSPELKLTIKGRH